MYININKYISMVCIYVYIHICIYQWFGFLLFLTYQWFVLSNPVWFMSAQLVKHAHISSLVFSYCS